MRATQGNNRANIMRGWKILWDIYIEVVYRRGTQHPNTRQLNWGAPRGWLGKFAIWSQIERLQSDYASSLIIVWKDGEMSPRKGVLKRTF